MLIKPNHEYISLDQHLTTKAIQLFDRLLEFNPSESIQKIRVIVGGLYDRAFEEVSRVNAERAEADAKAGFPSPNIGMFYNAASEEFFVEQLKSAKPDFAPGGFDPFSWERQGVASMDWGWGFDAVDATPP